MDEFIKSANKKQKGQGSKISSSKKIRKKSISLDKKKARAGYLFVLPFIVGFVLIYLPMIFDSIRFSFNEMELLRSGEAMSFTGSALITISKPSPRMQAS